MNVCIIYSWVNRSQTKFNLSCLVRHSLITIPSHRIGGPPRRRIIAADRALRMAGRSQWNGIAAKTAANPSGQEVIC